MRHIGELVALRSTTWIAGIFLCVDYAVIFEALLQNSKGAVVYTKRFDSGATAQISPSLTGIS